ncbi:hypothetical protein L6452_05403 [Arctium lappa]|uniref:Uncharacterized protein n=1 Tax=Arctium lappa TaxID=4217 RepID=A0ACB9EGB1_ARCLA|nr:hypothetical protein L6452_05403 [Arctium lappa]
MSPFTIQGFEFLVNTPNHLKLIYISTSSVYTFSISQDNQAPLIAISIFLSILLDSISRFWCFLTVVKEIVSHPTIYGSAIGLGSPSIPGFVLIGRHKWPEDISRKGYSSHLYIEIVDQGLFSLVLFGAVCRLLQVVSGWLPLTNSVVACPG